MKSKFTLLAVAVATIFTSCSKEAHFAYSDQNYGGYHKTEQPAAAQAPAEEVALTASTATQAEVSEKTVAYSAPKAVQTEVATAKTTEAAVATAAATMTKKEVKAVAKQIKKDVKKQKEAQGGKSQVVAAILCLLGMFGVHRFYLGYTGIAIIQLVLTILGFILIIPLIATFIWVVIDFVRILTGNLQPKDGSYEKTL